MRTIFGRRRLRWFLIIAAVMVIVCILRLLGNNGHTIRNLCKGDRGLPLPRQLVYRWIVGYDESVHRLLPNASFLRSLSWPRLAQLYHSYIENIQIVCGKMERMGNLKDGGWEICADGTHTPLPPCLVYSFGIKDDFSFDDDIGQKYGCHVHSFDPSTDMRDHVRSANVSFHATGLASFDGYWTSWRMRTLGSIIDELGHSGMEISALKLDIEGWEWQALPNMLASGALEDVSQLLVEFHLTFKPQPKRTRYLDALVILREIYEAGFRIFYTKINLHCAFRQIFDGRQKAGCHEVHMVRVKSPR